MEVFDKISPNKNLALGLGYFDGIHLGHKKLIKTLVNEAKNKNIKSAIITFKKNPADYFSEKITPNIQTIENRKKIIESLGIDFLYELDFINYKNLEAFEYLKNILIYNFSPKVIITGYNHTFGKNCIGNPHFLKKYSKKYNYEYISIPEQKYDNKKISSTIIRHNILKGDLHTTQLLLGRNFSINNYVIKGDNIATKLGYPTANLLWDNSLIKLPCGVYIGYGKIDSKKYPALISWGIKPTLTDGKKETLEAHLYNFSENIYDKNLEIEFIKKIRPQKKFKDITHLQQQLHKDYEIFKHSIQSML